MTAVVPKGSTVDVSPTTRPSMFLWLLGATCLPMAVVIAGSLADQDGPVRATHLLFGIAHVPLTFGLYADPDLRPFLRANPGRCFIAPALLVVGAAAVAVVTPAALLAYLIGGFVCWQLHHFAKQNLGVVSFWLRANRLERLDGLERKLMVALGVAAMGGVAPHLPSYANGQLPAAGFLSLVGFVVLVCASTTLVVRSDPTRRLPLVAACSFFLPLWLFPDNTTAAIIGFGVAHGAQYMLMVGHLSMSRRWLPVTLILTAVLGYLLLTAPASGSIAWGAVIGVTMSHFVVDAGLWRMSDPVQRSYISRRFSFL